MKGRGSLAMLMGVVAVVAAGLAAMKVAGEWLARGLLLLAFVGLLVATVGALVRRRRGAWIGIAVFGWGYLLLLVASSFMTTLSGSHGDDSALWRIDDLVDEIADRLYPVSPYPADPFTGVTTTFDPTSGRRAKVINDISVPFTPAESKIQADFEARASLHDQQLSSAGNARVIGLTLQGLAFAMLGAAAGHALSDRSTPPDASPGPPTTTLPG